MKILIIINNLSFGGIQTQSFNIAKGLQKKKAEVHFLGFRNYDSQFVSYLENEGFKVHYWQFLAKNSPNGLQRRIRLTRLWFKVRFFQFDVLMPFHFRTCIDFGLIYPYTNASVCFYHIRKSIKGKKQLGKLERKVYKNKPLVVTNSKHAKSTLGPYVTQFGLTIRQIYNGVCLRPIDTTKNWEEHFNTKGFDFVAVTLANFFPEKDYITLLKGWAEFLKRTSANAILCIGGVDSVLANSNSSNEYKNLVKDLKIEKNVHFLGAVKSNLELISIANVGILSSVSEGLPNVVLEVMAMGKPFIGTNIPGIREAVGKDYPINLFEVGDELELAQRLIEVYSINSTHKYEEIKDYSQNRINSLFSFERLGENYAELINQIMPFYKTL